MKNVKIESEFITLGQFLKYESIVPSVGLVKWFLSEHEVLVNDVLENRKGRKLYKGDIVNISSIGTYKIDN